MSSFERTLSMVFLILKKHNSTCTFGLFRHQPQKLVRLQGIATSQIDQVIHAALEAVHAELAHLEGLWLL